MSIKLLNNTVGISLDQGVVLSFVRLFVPEQNPKFPNSAPRYSANMIFDKKNSELVDALKSAAHSSFEFKQKKGITTSAKKRQQLLDEFFRDGDDMDAPEYDSSGKPTGERKSVPELAGKYVIRISSVKPVKIFGIDPDTGSTSLLVSPGDEPSDEYKSNRNAFVEPYVKAKVIVNLSYQEQADKMVAYVNEVALAPKELQSPDTTLTIDDLV